MRKLILGIESSCDETAVAIVEDNNKLLANVISTQIKVHEQYGGVMPEVASRLHLEAITPVLESALKEANVTMEEISAIAVTAGPGLIGALHVGLQAAKTLALVFKKPLIAVHHLAGHILANEFEKPIEYPCMGLIVSGGNTELVYMEKELSFKVIGQTLDDAIGEATDKAARVMGLTYPGGPQIDKRAKLGKNVYKLNTYKDENSFNFSYSGLKTSVINLVHNEKAKGNEIDINDLACSFQTIAMEQLLTKTIHALKEYPVKQLVLGGGVSANSYLREEIVKRVNKLDPNIIVSIPSMWCCMDNAAMIALVGSKLYDYQVFASLDIGANPDWDIQEFSL